LGVETVERNLGNAKVLFVATVRGLVREAGELRAAADGLAADCIVLPIGEREREEIETVLKEKGQLPGKEGNAPDGAGLLHGATGLPQSKIPFDPEEDPSDYDDFGLFVSTSDLVFMKLLSRFGEVEAPPPSYQEAMRYGNEKGVPVLAVDFDDDAYTDVFLHNVSAFTLIRQGRVLRKLSKRRFKEKTPEGFALAWDARVNRLRGYHAVEKAREERLAAGVAGAATSHQRILAVVEVERAAGVLAAFDHASRAMVAPRAAAPDGG
jgi:hypothetical protein